jgi:hypothetical protein
VYIALESISEKISGGGKQSTDGTGLTT